MSTSKVSIRSAIHEDAEGIALILKDVGWFEVFVVKPLEEVRAAVEHYIEACQKSGSTFLVAEKDGNVVGFAVVDWRPTLGFGCEGYLSQLYVHSSARGDGVGHQLIEGVREAAQSRECERLMTYISRKRGTYERGFYPKSGWSEREDAAMFIMSV